MPSGELKLDSKGYKTAKAEKKQPNYHLFGF